MNYNLTSYQQNQIKVIDDVEKQIKNNIFNFSTVEPVKDFNTDPRICLTSVHFPRQELISKIIKELINPLKKISGGALLLSR